MRKILIPTLILMLAIGCAPVKAQEAYDPEVLKAANEQELKFLLDNAMNHYVVKPTAKKHGIGYKLTHLGLTHKAATIAGSPFYVLGFTAACVGGLVGIPFTKAIQDFESKPFVSF